jgi:competence protein ComEC
MRGSVLAFILLPTLLASQTYAQSPDVMRLHFIDVGQGAATLLEFSCGAVLIDTGGENNAQFDSTDALMRYLNRFFSNRRDLNNRLAGLILTHPHVDHTANVRAVLDAYRPANGVTDALTSGSGRHGQIALHDYSLGADEQEDTADDISVKGVIAEEVGANGLNDATVDPVTCPGRTNPEITALWGQVTTSRPGWSNDDYENENNHSVAVRVRFGGASALWTGDMEVDGIREFLAQYATDALDVDVYQVGHHGSANATTAELLQAMTPEYAVISMGPFDRELSWTAWAHGHPRKVIVDMLEARVQGTRAPVSVNVARGQRDFRSMQIGKAIYATGWDGDIVFEATPAGEWTVLQPSLLSSLTTKVNINTATIEQLLDLPGIGQTKAQAILAFVQANNRGLTALAQLDSVSGIGPATLLAIEPFVTVQPVPQ